MMDQIKTDTHKQVTRRRRGLLTRAAVAKYYAEAIRNFATAFVVAIVAGIVVKLISPPPERDGTAFRDADDPA